MRARPCLGCLLVFAGCGNSAVTEAVAAPVNAPMVARERLLHDLDGQRDTARQRAGVMADVVDGEEADTRDH
jgi:hypothetical protein